MRFEVFPQRVAIFNDLDVQWYWRLRSSNGKIVATGGEAYAKKANAKRACHRLIENFARDAWGVTVIEVAQ